MVVKTVVKASREVVTSGLAIDFGGFDGFSETAEGGVEAGGLLPWLVGGGWDDCGGGAGVDLGGSELGGGFGVTDGVDTGGGRFEVGGGRGEDEGGDGDGEPPVPLACRFSPWWRYASMPSMCRSSMPKADEWAARAKTAANSQRVRSMVGGCGRESERVRGRLSRGPDGLRLTRFTQRGVRNAEAALGGGLAGQESSDRVAG